jgi:tRNA threonylcarbamoyladenosine biosynthesis protein TsaE
MKIISTSAAQTKKIGRLLAEELRGGEIICLSGDLGAGKTTFTQGLLKGLKIKGPYTSPTFNIIKEYEINLKFKISNLKLSSVYHIDAYRISSKDLAALGFKDFAGQKNTVVIIEWPEKIKSLIPTDAVWIHFKWLNEKERAITFDAK